MLTVVLSTSYLPPIEYFVCLKRAEMVLIEGNESYTKQTYRNRCVIAGPNGALVLTVPVIHKKCAIRDVQIDYATPWQASHWRSIEAAYNRSPFFSYYRDEFEPFYLSRHKFLFDLNSDLLSLCMRLSKISRQIIYTELFQKNYPKGQDLRTLISPKNPDTRMEFPRYPQVFEPVLGFLPNLSFIDILFNRGPDAEFYLDEVGSLDQTGYSTRM